MATWRLYYDGGCNLCHVSRLRVEGWAKRAKQPLDIDVLASDEAVSKGYGENIVVEADGRVFEADQAWFKLASLGPWYVRWIASLNQFRPTRAIVRWVYGVVAKYRYKWFGTRSCPVPERPKVGK